MKTTTRNICLVQTPFLPVRSSFSAIVFFCHFEFFPLLPCSSIYHLSFSKPEKHCNSGFALSVGSLEFNIYRVWMLSSSRRNACVVILSQNHLYIIFGRGAFSLNNLSFFGFGEYPRILATSATAKYQAMLIACR